MKKVFTLLALFILVTINVNAQTHKTVKKTTTTATTHTTVAVKHTLPPPPPPPVIKTDEYSVMDKNYLNLGVGVGTYFNGTPFGASFEHGFTDAISAGVFVDYSSYNDGGGFKTNIFYGGVRGSYHFAKLLNIGTPKFDPYAGISIGYANVSFNGDIAAYSSGVLVGVHAGARYLFSPNIGAFAEVGYGVAALDLGVSFKF